MAYIDVGKFVNFIRNSNMEKQDKNTVLVAMQLQPTADVVKVKHGEWEKAQFVQRSGFRTVRDFICGICGKVYAIEQPCNLMNYCPYCGAKMDGGEAE